MNGECDVQNIHFSVIGLVHEFTKQSKCTKECIDVWQVIICGDRWSINDQWIMRMNLEMVCPPYLFNVYLVSFFCIILITIIMNICSDICCFVEAIMNEAISCSYSNKDDFW